MGRKSHDGPSGFAVVDKEAGWTSHDVVGRARKVLNTRKIGHSGTLDPPATGVLVLGVGKATRLLRFITALEKTYEATMVMGTETSTLDAEGEVTARHDMGVISMAAVEAAALGFVGAIEQIPPMVSAVKIDGKRLHELAREGIEVPRDPRPVTVHDLVVTQTSDPNVFGLRVRCSAGTYVRTLAADIGAALGGGAHIATLRRTAIGRFTEVDATAVDDIELLSLADGLSHLPVVAADAEIATLVGFGKPLARDDVGATGDGPWAVLDHVGELIAVYEVGAAGAIKPAVVLAPA